MIRIVISVVLTLLIILPNLGSAEERFAKWTVMVFLNGDNNLEYYGIKDFNEMERVGSSADVNIVVQFDRALGYDNSNGDWTTCRRYRVTYDDYPDSITSELIQDLGEVNMGDPLVLADFGSWAKQNFPADNYLLIIWNHGDGWREGGQFNEPIKGVSYDESSGDYISVAQGELAQALSTIGDVSVIGFDACLMQMWEVMENVLPYADYMVGSEETESADGWNYTGFLQELNANSMMYPLSLGLSIINNTYQSTLSVVDLSQMPALTKAVDTFALELMRARDQGFTDTIVSARYATRNFYEWSYIDLYDFANEITRVNVPQFLKEVAQNLMNSVEDVVKGTHNTYPDAHGISIYHPSKPSYYSPQYSNLEVASSTLWDEYLRGYKYNDSLGIYGGYDPNWSGYDTLKYDGAPYSFWGYADDPPFYAAVRFTPARACTLTGVLAFFNHEFPYTLYIYDTDIYLMPQNILYHKTDTSHHCWNYIELETPIEIESNKDFWIAIYTENAYYPIGVDNGNWSAHRSFVSFDGDSWEEAIDNGIYYNFNIRAEVKYDPSTLVEELPPFTERDFGLIAYPNPFYNRLNIRYQIPDSRLRNTDRQPSVSLKIYDATGRLVKQFNHLTNYQSSIMWFGDDDFGRELPAGVYFIQIKSGDFCHAIKTALLK